jgi:hypothetical protein
MAEFVPTNDADFNSWQRNLVAITETMLIPWSIVTGDFATLKSAQTVWEEGYSPAEVKTVRNNGDVKGKDSARATYEKAVRTFVKQWLANNTRVTDRDRELMGLTVPTGTRTPVPKPSTAPVGNIDFSARMRHKLHIVDEATPTRKAKPAGVYGCEIWMKIDGLAPTDASELTYVATATRTPCTIMFNGKDAAKPVYYWLRWVNKRQEHGQWSNVIVATIVG